MKASVQLATQQEADLVQRFARGYRGKLAEIIGKLNNTLVANSTDPRQQESVRYCIEAVDLVLSSHEHFARLLGTLARLDQ
jgi:hypothetical protein